MIKEIKPGLLDNSLLAEFPSQYPLTDFFNFVQNKVNLEGVLAVAGILAPSFTLFEDCVFLTDWNPYMRRDEQNERLLSQIIQREGRKKTERYANAFALEDYFLMAADESCFDELLVSKFALIIEHFWRMHLAFHFPNRVFEFELGENIHNETGKVITFSQV